jgi:hypothetical protein
MVETVKKPSLNLSAKERRNTLFHVLDGLDGDSNPCQVEMLPAQSLFFSIL